MSESRTQPPPDGNGFLNAPVVLDVADVDGGFAVLGVPYGMAGVHNATSDAPGAIRRQSLRFGYGAFIDHWDFDLGGPLLAGRDVPIVDMGDVVGDPMDIPATVERATTAVRELVGRGAIPIVLGGDDSIPIPVLRAYESRGPLTLVQIDAHIDWRDEVGGVTEGYSSPMRRASEMEWVGDIIQVGMRGVGSARERELRDAEAYGAAIVTAREVHRDGVERAVIERVPDGEPCFITVDCDGLDPSVMPAVGAPSPGGLTYTQVVDVLHGVTRKAPVIGMCLVELAPARDVNGISALTAVRIILNLIGSIVRTGQLGRGTS